MDMQLGSFAGPAGRNIKYAFYDWTRELAHTKRIWAWGAILAQGYAIYCLAVRSLVWPIMWPRPLYVFVISITFFYSAYTVMNALLAAELVRKTRMESDRIAARQIQQTLVPQQLEKLPGYTIESFYKPLREVGGDYFDVINLAANKTLLAIADVSGKGMAAALLSASVQALVRNIANAHGDPLTLAQQINQHLNLYSPSDCFATAVFVLLDRDSGKLTYVNAGHDFPLVVNSASAVPLPATGVPLGLFANAEYTTQSATLNPGGTLVLFTDGLVDSVPGTSLQERLQDIVTSDSGNAVEGIKSLIDAKFNQDDVTFLLVRRDL